MAQSDKSKIVKGDPELDAQAIGEKARVYSNEDTYFDLAQLKTLMKDMKIWPFIKELWKYTDKSSQPQVFVSTKSNKYSIMGKCDIESATYHRYIRQLVKQEILKYTPTKGRYLVWIKETKDE